MARNCNDWQTGKSLAQCMGHLLENGLYADVQFACVGLEGGPAVLVDAHRVVLAARSPVFEQMFFGSLPESGAIPIPDIEPPVFQAMLRFLYTEEAPVYSGNVIQLLYASSKYLLEGLTEKCIYFLDGQLDSDNVCDILMSVWLYKDEGSPSFQQQYQSLIEKCINLLQPRANDILASAKFSQLPEGVISIILPDDKLVVEGERVVYSACLNWAKYQCKSEGTSQEPENYRRRLGDNLLHIRFTVLLDELLQGESESMIDDALGNIELLTEAEKRDLASFKRTSQPNRFTDNLKKNLRYKFGICDRYPNVIFGEDGWKCEGIPDPLAFTCDDDIYLIGAGVYGPKNDRGSFTVKVTVNDHGDSLSNIPKALGQIDTMSLRSTGQTEPYKVYFQSPIFLAANTVYTVYLVITGQPSFFGRGGRNTLDCHGVNFSFIPVSKRQRKNKTDAHTGQLPQLLFRL